MTQVVAVQTEVRKLPASSLAVRLGDYLELCKPNVVLLIVFTAVVGMLLAVPGSPPLVPMLAGTLGIALAASSAAAINQLHGKVMKAEITANGEDR